MPFLLELYPIHFFLTVRGMLHQTRHGLPSAYIDCTFILTCSRSVSFLSSRVYLEVAAQSSVWRKGVFCREWKWKACFPLMQPPAHLIPECDVSTLYPPKGFKRLFSLLLMTLLLLFSFYLEIADFLLAPPGSLEECDKYLRQPIRKQRAFCVVCVNFIAQFVLTLLSRHRPVYCGSYAFCSNTFDIEELCIAYSPQIQKSLAQLAIARPLRKLIKV